ncbi:MAG: hypothetical protein WA194_00715 [Patescibacteria group bacterium]
MTGSDNSKDASSSMFDELMRTTPGAPAAPGVDPLSTLLAPESAAPAPIPVQVQSVAPAVPDAVPGSA